MALETNLVSRLEQKFGLRRVTALEMMDEVLQGKALPEKDANALLEFYGKLAEIYAMAEQTGRAGEFETRTSIEAVLKKKLPHLSVKWTEKAVKCRMNQDRDMTFREFLKFINERHDFLDQLNRTMAGSSFQPGVSKGAGGAKVAATVAAPAAAAAPKATPSSTGCAACGAGHSLSACPRFVDMDAGAKRKICSGAGACFRCLERGHLASSCGSEAKCGSCGGAHLSAAHGLQRRDGSTTSAKTPA